MTVQQLLTTISSRELTEWMQYFAWKEKQDSADREYQQQVSKAERWVNERR